MRLFRERKLQLKEKRQQLKEKKYKLHKVFKENKLQLKRNNLRENKERFNSTNRLLKDKHRYRHSLLNKLSMLKETRQHKELNKQ